MIINITMIYLDGIINGFSQRYIGSISFIISIIIFSGITHREIKYSEKTKLIITKLGSCTLCVYLLEPYFRWLLYDLLYILSLSVFKSVFVCSIIWCVLCFAIGCFASTILKKVPILKSYL